MFCTVGRLDHVTSRDITWRHVYKLTGQQRICTPRFAQERFSLCRLSHACVPANNSNAHTQNNRGPQTRMNKTHGNDQNCFEQSCVQAGLVVVARPAHPCLQTPAVLRVRTAAAHTHACARQTTTKTKTLRVRIGHNNPALGIETKVFIITYVINYYIKVIRTLEVTWALQKALRLKAPL